MAGRKEAGSDKICDVILGTRGNPAYKKILSCAKRKVAKNTFGGYLFVYELVHSRRPKSHHCILETVGRMQCSH